MLNTVAHSCIAIASTVCTPSCTGRKSNNQCLHAQLLPSFVASRHKLLRPSKRYELYAAGLPCI